MRMGAIARTWLVVTAMAALGVHAVDARQAAFTAEQCFPFERLPDRLRARAERLLLTALDGEALYTIASDIKPMSSGILTLEVGAGQAGLLEVADLEEIMRAWSCGGEVSGGLHRFAAVYDDGRRPMDLMVFNHPRVGDVVARRSGVYGPLGLAPETPPLAVVQAVDRAARTPRFLGYGYLFGYPDAAVEFFAEADDRQQQTGAFVERDFISLPTFRGERHFVYAVPRGQARTDADRVLAERVQPVYDDYVARRARHIKDDTGAGVLALLREWFDDGRGDVRPSHAWRAVEAAASAR